MNRFIFKMAWRETRGAWRHFLYFFACIAIGVGALVGVSLFSTNVERAVTKEARGLLGGDLEIRLTHPLSLAGQAVLDSLGERDMVFTHVSELVAMAARATHGSVATQSTQIIELKAVESMYPLYGAIRLDPAQSLDVLLHPDERRCGGHSCFGAVVQESLLIRMGLSVGDRLKIGQAMFLITGIVRTEPDRMANAFTLGPRVMIAQEGLRAAELIKPGSRVRERYLVKMPLRYAAGAAPLRAARSAGGRFRARIQLSHGPVTVEAISRPTLPLSRADRSHRAVHRRTGGRDLDSCVLAGQDADDRDLKSGRRGFGHGRLDLCGASDLPGMCREPRWDLVGDCAPTRAASPHGRSVCVRPPRAIRRLLRIVVVLDLALDERGDAGTVVDAAVYPMAPVEDSRHSPRCDLPARCRTDDGRA